jgi:hypothetical protein
MATTFSHHHAANNGSLSFLSAMAFGGATMPGLIIRRRVLVRRTLAVLQRWAFETAAKARSSGRKEISPFDPPRRFL